MPTKLNGNINGIEYINVDGINRADQPWCPLEHTILESQCKNPYHNVTLRSDTPCEHSQDCARLLIKPLI